MKERTTGIPVFHVGLPKTGSTTLQNMLFARHSQLFYLGKHVAYPGGRGCRSELIHHFLEPLLWDLKQPLDVAAHRALWHGRIAPDADAGGHKQIVGSWEGLGNEANERHTKTLSRLRETVGECRLLYVLRNPLSQLPSLYLQDLQGSFIRRNRPWSNKGFVDLDDWLAWKYERSGILNYDANIQSAEALFGKQNIGVFLYENFTENPARYYRSICEFLGINPAEGESLGAGIHHNRRLSTAQLALLKEKNSSWLKRRALKSMSAVERRRMLDDLNQDGEPVRLALSPTAASKVVEMSRGGHRRLAETFALPLSDYGYPL